MTDRELGQIIAPTMFCLATGDPFLSPAQARPAIARIPEQCSRSAERARPWLEDPAGCAKLVTNHLTATGFAPAA